MFVSILDNFISMTSGRQLKRKNLLNCFNCLIPIRKKCIKMNFENNILPSRYLVQKY